MRERPILFGATMVRAILADTKTQTRRTKALEYFSRPDNDPEGWWCARVADGVAYLVYKNAPHERAVRCPYGQPGDRLWVRETWAAFDADWRHPGKPADLRDGPWPNVAYAADGDFPLGAGRPSIHMPRWACRLALEVTGVRVERLQAIDSADAIAEGVGLNPSAADVSTTTPEGESLPRVMFRALWEEINGASAWCANPWVWVIEFRRIR